jgi:hypothetical protein
MSARIDEARRVVLSLLDDLEGAASPIDAVLMKAKRLARLMRDADAQLWLDLETRGYPNDFMFAELGTCAKYAASGARLNVEASTFNTKSLPAIEAYVVSEEALLASLRLVRSPTTTVRNFTEARATNVLMKEQLERYSRHKTAYVLGKGLFASMKAELHNYATDTFLAIELGNVAENIFESARDEVDTFVRSHCPKAAEKLIAINERMADRSSESRTAALTSCRRLLMTVADALFPPKDQQWTDPNGKARKVGAEQYKNRLLAYLAESTQSRGTREVITSELEHLADRLDAIYEKTCKGVHVNVSEQEARLTVIHTYLFIGEIAQYPPEKNDVS